MRLRIGIKLYVFYIHFVQGFQIHVAQYTVPFHLRVFGIGMGQFFHRDVVPFAVVDADGEYVAACLRDVRSKIVAMGRGEAFFMSVDLHTVDPYLRIPQHAFQMQKQFFAFPSGGDLYLT